MLSTFCFCIITNSTLSQAVATNSILDFHSVSNSQAARINGRKDPFACSHPPTTMNNSSSNIVSSSSGGSSISRAIRESSNRLTYDVQNLIKLYIRAVVRKLSKKYVRRLTRRRLPINEKNISKDIHKVMRIYFGNVVRDALTHLMASKRPTTAAVLDVNVFDSLERQTKILFETMYHFERRY